MKLIATNASNAIVELTEDDLLTLLACMSEAREALSNADEFRIRVGVSTNEAQLLWEELRKVRHAVGRPEGQ